MYIAGLHFFSPSPQGVEGLAVLTTADFFRYLLWKSRPPKVTKEEGGPVSAPRSLVEKLVFPTQALAALLPPAVYCTAVVFNKFRQPAWMLQFALPENIVRTELKYRKRPGMNQTGPYAVVRHHSVMLLQQVFYSVMYWSYVPLASLGVLAGVFAIKMPMEEKAAKENDVIGNDYVEYMERVPARVIPHIW